MGYELRIRLWQNKLKEGDNNMKNKKIIIAILSIILIAFTTCMALFAFPRNEMPATYTEAKEGVVFIASSFGDYAVSTGSGFAIGKSGESVKYIVTNYHVVFDTDTGEKADSVAVYFSAAANRYMIAQIYRYSASKDIAVLRLPEATDEVKPLRLCKYSDNDTSKMFFALGYPARATAGTDYERYDKTEIVTTSGMISRQTMINERDVYMLDLDITSGNSGGPLVNEKGEVVGINTFSIIDTSGDETNYAVCIDELTRIIDGNEVPYALSTDINTNGVVIIVIIAVVDVILIAGILIVALSKKKNIPVNEPVKPSRSSENFSNRRDDSSYNRDNYMKTRAVSEMSPTMAVTDEIVVINCIGGPLEGKDFILRDKLIFGRDAKRCKVVFPLDSEGVSGIHCQVTLENGKVKIMDLGSTYGTFVGNGLKIDAEVAVELKDGDTFYLGSKKNKFSVNAG